MPAIVFLFAGMARSYNSPPCLAIAQLIRRVFHLPWPVRVA
jgi:hypothetical protein